MHNNDSILLESLYEDILLENTDDMKNITVKSEAVKRLRQAVSDMLERGAPVERNDYGFNGGDYTAAQMLMGNKDYHIGADEMPVYIIKRILDMLYKYKKTQLGGIYSYDEERSVLENEIKVVTKQQNSKEDTGKIIIDNNDEKYGKVAVTIPEEKLKRGQLNKVVNSYCEQMGMQLAYNQWGKEEFIDKWKAFQKHPVKFGTYYMKPDLALKVAQELFPDIEIKELGGSEGSSKEEQVSNNNLKVEIVSKLQTAYGRKLEITLGSAGSPISKNIYFACKNAGLTPKLLSFDMQTKKIFMDDKKESYEILKPFFEQGLDVSELDRHFENPQEETPDQQTQQVQGGYALNVEYVMREGIRIAPDYRSGVPEDAKKVFRECIRYLFPSAKWENYMANLQGDYEQYVKLGKILKDNNFNVDKLREIFKRMKEDGLLKPSRELSLKTPEQVSGATDKDFPESGFQLFGLQKEGVDFLYKNKYAILGSETGGGKTVQMVYAAELVYKEEKKPILIVTLKRVQNQFVDEIVAVMGDDERKEISVNPMATKKWNVLYYENFSAGKDLENVIKHLSSQEYSVVIFDELHKLKHSTSKRSQNLEKVAQKAKCRWGATATVSANKPMDVKNQLAILGHPMGMLDDGKFKREFTGMVSGGYGGAYVDGDFEDRIRAAEHLNKWMHLTGIYVRHSKEDMRSEKGEKMPDIKIDKETLQSIKDEDKFKKEVDAKISGYKDPSLAISQMLAFRDIIAKQKTDETVNMAMDIVVKNQKVSENNFSSSKVLIFTNFKEAGAELVRKSEEALASTNPKWKAYSFLSSTPKKELEMVKKRMEDPNAKILVMSMKMGGTGISFPNTFKTMIVNDYDWTPESVEQSEGRIYRINTNQNVRIIYNINPGGDEKLYANVEMKKQLAKIIQTYRKIYQDEKVSDQDSEALKKIIDAQKKLAQVEEDDLKIISGELGKSTMKESFAKYFVNKL